ncbi:MAG: NAD(P)H-dependent oxidoreductase [Spirochaetales bacterium]|nr:NAD(P)H-dependent oxidoreductase [Spirochaetales bacterium]
MNCMIIECHPDDHSFCHAIAMTIKEYVISQAHSVYYHSLYQENFSPVLSLEELKRGFSLDEEIQQFTNGIEKSECVVFVHPDWWGGPPAMLKGWIERVFRSGVAFEFRGDDFEKKHHQSLLENKTAFVFCTSDRQKPEGYSVIEESWKDVFRYCGIQRSHIELFYNVHDSTYDERQAFLREIKQIIQKKMPAQE